MAQPNKVWNLNGNSFKIWDLNSPLMIKAFSA